MMASSFFFFFFEIGAFITITGPDGQKKIQAATGAK
jgi:hypothetical protein